MNKERFLLMMIVLVLLVLTDLFASSYMVISLAFLIGWVSSTFYDLMD